EWTALVFSPCLNNYVGSVTKWKQGRRQASGRTRHLGGNQVHYLRLNIPTSAEVLRGFGTKKSDEEVTCFRDIKPGAPHHYLVVPTKHVGDCKSLNKQHVPLVEKMVETGKKILQKNNVLDLSDVRFGFHWPPFCSVSHLHLHVLAPASQMGLMSSLFYRLNSYWFVTADQLIQHLNSKGEAN
uniref:Adenosine 5'-monophosphoramidase HINT3 n=1 Tax=Esox lucius TaxID=8010 RepID=A0AAY5LA89_ESOLU